MMKAGGDDDENSGIGVVSLEDGLNAMEANSSQLGDWMASTVVTTDDDLNMDETIFWANSGCKWWWQFPKTY